MRAKIGFFTLLLTLTLCSCSSTDNFGPGYGHEELFRERLNQALPEKCKLKSFRFAKDYQKVLIFFDHDGRDNTFEMKADPFQRYEGTLILTFPPFSDDGSTQNFKRKNIIVDIGDK